MTRHICHVTIAVVFFAWGFVLATVFDAARFDSKYECAARDVRSGQCVTYELRGQ